MLGPLDIDFDEEAVAEYLDTTNPTATEKACLQDFFEELQSRGSNVPYTSTGEYYVVDTCGYIIHLRDLADDGSKARVERIARPSIGQFRTP